MSTPSQGQGRGQGITLPFGYSNSQSLQTFQGPQNVQTGRTFVTPRRTAPPPSPTPPLSQKRPATFEYPSASFGGGVREGKGRLEAEPSVGTEEQESDEQKRLREDLEREAERMLVEQNFNLSTVGRANPSLDRKLNETFNLLSSLASGSAPSSSSSSSSSSSPYLPSTPPTFPPRAGGNGGGGLPYTASTSAGPILSTVASRRAARSGRAGPIQQQSGFPSSTMQRPITLTEQQLNAVEEEKVRQAIVESIRSAENDRLRRQAMQPSPSTQPLRQAIEDLGSFRPFQTQIPSQPVRSTPVLPSQPAQSYRQAIQELGSFQPQPQLQSHTPQPQQPPQPSLVSPFPTYRPSSLSLGGSSAYYAPQSQLQSLPQPIIQQPRPRPQQGVEYKEEPRFVLFQPIEGEQKRSGPATAEMREFVKELVLAAPQRVQSNQVTQRPVAPQYQSQPQPQFQPQSSTSGSGLAYATPSSVPTSGYTQYGPPRPPSFPATSSQLPRQQDFYDQIITHNYSDWSDDSDEDED